MKCVKVAVAITTAVAVLCAGNAGAQKASTQKPAAQKARVSPAPAIYEGSVAFGLPEEKTSVALNGLKTARVAWLTFSKFQDGTTSKDQQVITLMEGAVVKWSGPQSCSYEFTLVANPPAIVMNKNPRICALRQGGTAEFRIVAM